MITYAFPIGFTIQLRMMSSWACVLLTQSFKSLKCALSRNVCLFGVRPIKRVTTEGTHTFKYVALNKHWFYADAYNLSGIWQGF